MDEIVKICKIHGELTLSQAMLRKDAYGYTCRECHSRNGRKHYQENKDACIKRMQTYNQKNKEKITQKRRLLYGKNAYKKRKGSPLIYARAIAASEEFRKKAREELRDSYIRNLLVKSKHFSKEDIEENPSLISIKRAIVAIRRHISEQH